MTGKNTSRRAAAWPKAALVALLAVAASPLGAAAEGVLNLYSSRHYDTDEQLYAGFEAKTGIKINRIEAKADALIERMKAEGPNSPADVLITVDAGRIWRAQEADVLQPVKTDLLEQRVPAHLRHPNGDWYAFSQRARMIFYSKSRVKEPPQTYEALADPKYKGRICTRSSSNIYNLSLLASIIAHSGEKAAKDWAAGLYANRARDPKGGDTDQLRGIVSGECDIVIANSYYFIRGLTGNVKNLTDGIDDIGWIFPNQDGRGAHVNVSVGAVAKHAPNKDNAIKFLEYLTEKDAQEYFANGNNEFPAVPGVDVGAGAAKLGPFKTDELNLSKLGENQLAAQRVFDEVGYK